MMSRKTMGFTGGLLILTAVVLVGFQNCAPEQYFKAQKSDSTDGSSNGGNGTLGLSGQRYAITVGELKTTDAGRTAGVAILGRSMVVRDSYTQSTEVFNHAVGLPVSTQVASHVHDLPCAIGGGGHYKLDYSNPATVQSNEIWPLINSGADGIGSGYTRVSHYARPEAQSVVIHDAAGARHACANLHSTWSAQTKGGLFANLTAGVTTTPALRGSAVIARNAGDGISVVRLSVNGLLPNTSYGSHVHNLPCATTEGGAHYKQNAEVTEVVATAANEMWTSFTTNATGHGETRLQVPHVARADAASIVIHDSVTPTVRLACVDLSIDAAAFVGTELGITRFPNVFGSAKLERLGNGQTKVTVAASGLTPITQYVMHVHDRPCHIAAGGGHYKIDYNVASAIESNEIWMRVTTDAAGAGSAITTVNHIARPEAYSVVIHDTDTSRIACADLY